MAERPQPPEPLKPIPVYLHVPEPLPEAPPARPPRVLAFLTLGLGILAFLNGWLPIVGIVLGLAAVIAGALAVLQKQPKVYAVTGLALGGVGVLSSVLATYFLYN